MNCGHHQPIPSVSKNRKFDKYYHTNDLQLCRYSAAVNSGTPHALGGIEEVVVQSVNRIIGSNSKGCLPMHTAGSDEVHTIVGVNAVGVNSSEVGSFCVGVQLIASIGAAIRIGEIAYRLHLLPSLVRDQGMGMPVIDVSQIVPVRVGNRVSCL